MFIRDNAGTYRRADLIARAEPQGANYLCETDEGASFAVSADEFEEARDMATIVPAAPGYTTWAYDLDAPTGEIWRSGRVIAWAIDDHGMVPTPITDEDGKARGDEVIVGAPDGTFYIPHDRGFDNLDGVKAYVAEKQQHAATRRATP